MVRAVEIYILKRYEVSPEIGTLCLTLAIGVPGYLVSSMFSSGALLESSYAIVSTCAGGFWAWTQTDHSEGDSDDEPEDDEPEDGLGDNDLS